MKFTVCASRFEKDSYQQQRSSRNREGNRGFIDALSGSGDGDSVYINVSPDLGL
jgi:hypothetical protein